MAITSRREPWSEAMHYLFLAFSMILTFAMAATGETYQVSPDGGGDYPTIQAAIDAALDGDTVELTAGTFIDDGNRDIDYLGKAITVRSQDGNPQACIIDCQGSERKPHRGFHFHSAEQDGSVLTGVTIRNGWATLPPHGGAILCEEGSSPLITSCVFSGNRYSAVYCCEGSSPAITACVFTQNEAQEGGGLYSEASSPSVSHCDFIQNSAEWNGGAFLGSASSATFSNCRFVRNSSAYSAGAVCFFYGSEPAFVDCLFEENATSSSGSSGAVQFFCFVTGTLDGCTFVGNSAGTAGSIVSTGKMSHTIVTGCTFWGNSVPSGAIVSGGELDVTIDNTIIAFSLEGQAISAGEHTVALTCCDLYGNAGGDWVGGIADQYGINGNISEDPLFCDPAAGNFTLQACSPCTPFSPPNSECDLIGAWPIGCAGTPVTSITWGGIKGLFRQ
ncbi:MAG: right-handed parallel beta-helix repeat-containing protein [Candidatus Eisenbacteria sp.]|nr:right-handed parallel beta-helix repeat-containing protein [Candidatus Eisenbacteria bacterium]